MNSVTVILYSFTFIIKRFLMVKMKGEDGKDGREAREQEIWWR